MPKAVSYIPTTIGDCSTWRRSATRPFCPECAINMLADKMGIDPLEFRLQNSLKPGQTKSTGSKVEQWPFPELCEAIRPHYERACQQARKHENKTIKRGVGLAAGAFGIGGPGDRAIAAVELDPDGGVTIFAAAADPGEGNDPCLPNWPPLLWNCR